MSIRLLCAALAVAALASAAANTTGAIAQSVRVCCPVLELRQYTLKPGQRDVLIDVFDRHFVESQEAAGMTIVGQFRDRRRPERFVWIRGFADMKTRHTALETFYGGPVWAEHKAAANATMVDVSDVRLLKPAQPGSVFRVDVSSRPLAGDARPRALVLAGVHTLPQPADPETISRFQQHAIPALRGQRVEVAALFVTETAPNTFTRLPVRAGEHVLVWFGTTADGPAPEAARLRTAIGLPGNPDFALLELEPTTRSLFGVENAKR